MKFYAYGIESELTYGEVQASGYGHLLNNAPYLECSHWHRKSYTMTQAGERCNMTQPDATQCQGILRNLK